MEVAELKFGERLKSLRKICNMTQGELGNELDYGHTAIANYESGKTQPSIEKLIKIAGTFGVSIDYLVGSNTGQEKAQPVEGLGTVLEHYEDLQISKACEELGGLVADLNRYVIDVRMKRPTQKIASKIIERIAGVNNMMYQLEILFGVQEDVTRIEEAETYGLHEE